MKQGRRPSILDLKVEQLLWSGTGWWCRSAHVSPEAATSVQGADSHRNLVFHGGQDFCHEVLLQSRVFYKVLAAVGASYLLRDVSLAELPVVPAGDPVRAGCQFSSPTLISQSHSSASCLLFSLLLSQLDIGQCQDLH